ncbi:unnamed protein product [Caenorhabditis brenneri]
MGDQYLCLDQVKEDGKVPPPPPQTANAVPAPAVPPPPPSATFVKVPAPPPNIQKEKSTSKIETVNDQKSSRNEMSVVSHSTDGESRKKGISPTTIRIMVAVNNVIFIIAFSFWFATLLTGLRVVKIEFINNMFSG